MPKCAYCSGDLKKGTGLMYVYRTGNIAYYCSNTCFKNHVRLGRKISRKLATKGAKPVKVPEKGKA